MTLVGMEEPVQHLDMRTRTKAGRPVWLKVSVLAPTSPTGERRIIHLFRDVTATKQLLALGHERLAPPAAEPGPAAPAAALSRRELEVLRCMTQGLNTRAHRRGACVDPVAAGIRAGPLPADRMRLRLRAADRVASR